MYVWKHQLTISGGMLYSLMTISTRFQIRVKTKRMFLSIFSNSEHALRSPDLRESDEAKKLVQDEFEELARSVRVALYSGYTNALTGLPTQDSHGYGATVQRWGAKRIKIYIGIEMIQPLLRKDLNDVET
jgi:hypothetical protein